MKRTPLYNEHLKLKAKMVPFGGWEMPVQYTGVIEEHLAVRNDVGMFDAGHMGVVRFIETESLLQVQGQALTRAIHDLVEGRIRYNRIRNDQDGIVDDILVYKNYEQYLAVFNASNVDKDIAYFAAKGITCELMGLHIIALQGPRAEEILQKHTEEDLSQIKYYGFIATDLEDEIESIISRTGYTGEKGFEIMVSAEDSPKLWNILLADGVKPCGLGARDTLRIEAGMPLYGHELKDEWTSEDTDSIVGLKIVEKNGIPRQGFAVVDRTGRALGEVTSGTFSPSLQQPIAMAYIPEVLLGDTVYVNIRNKPVPAEVVKLPFVSKVRK
jgi:aminomethyltransferase